MSAHAHSDETGAASLSQWQANTLSRLAACNGDPAQLTLAALDISLGDHAARLRPLIEAASIPHWFSRAILVAMLGEGAGSEADYAALTALSQVEPWQGQNAWNVHESTRLALRNYLVNTDPERFRSLSAHAKAYFERQGRAISPEESCFHGLACSWENAFRMARFLVNEPGSANRSPWLLYFREFMRSDAPKRLYRDFGRLMLWKRLRLAEKLFADHEKLLRDPT